MKKANSIRALLGVSQQDMAMLLRISRSQLAMFELGKRGLPVAAKVVLAEILAFLKSPELSSKMLPQEEQVQALQLRELECLHKENEYQLALVTKKIKAVEKKYATKVKILHLVDSLSLRSIEKESSEQDVLKLIASKATKSLEKEGLTVLVKHQLKQDFLELEKVGIESKLRKITLSL